MKIGTARIDLTPPEGSEFYLLGYKHPGRNEPAKGVHDHIFANAILFQNGEDEAFLWTADLLELPDDTAADMRTKLSDAFGINRDHILLSVMHDHSSIRDFHRDWEFGKYNPKYDEFLMQSAVDAFQICRENAREATARTGKKIVEGFYSNRNHPDTPADNMITIIRFYDADEKPFAAIVNWAVHSTVLGASNMYLTGDLAGNTCRKLGEAWGYFPVFVNGAAGDCSNRFNRQGKDFAELDRATDGLRDAILAIETDAPVELRNPRKSASGTGKGAAATDAGIDAAAAPGATSIGGASETALEAGGITTIALSHEIAPDVSAYHALLNDTLAKIERGECEVAGDLPADHLREKCLEQLQAPPFKLVVPFAVMDIGDLRFFSFPGELASKFGIELRDAFPKKTVVVAGYSNGFHYYFLNKEEYGLSFETIGNPVPAGEPEKIVEKMIQAGRLLDAAEQRR